MKTRFDPNVWGPHYWFFIHTIAHSYPDQANAVSKRKYYDFIQNLPLFIPDAEMSNTFSEMLDKYPVTPYLDNRDSFIRWTHFIHNKMNAFLGKEEISLYAGIDKYMNEYLPKPVSVLDTSRFNSNIIHFVAILIGILLCYMFYS